ncbi:peptidase [Burkholderia pyrrocinia]|uniref:peptidase n=1 Tax=Burkholderia pyrrocinia TaxID=60550 RepID=UPI001053CF13|nr:peptidase [Burkholderia pyrrocinia]TDA48792.1 peptidase [Burkholderia pyrrocinia]
MSGHHFVTIPLAVLLSCVVPATAVGKMPRTNFDSGLIDLTRGVAASSASHDKTKDHDRSRGTVVAMSDPSYRATPASGEAMAREFLRARASVFGLSRIDIDSLVVTGQRDSDNFSVVRFQQVSDGLRVFGSDIAVTVTPDGRVLYVSSNVLAVAPMPMKKSVLEKNQALDRARAYLGAPVFSHASAEQVALSDGTETHPAWRVDAVLLGTSDGDWEIVIDATTGEVVRAEDKLLSARGRALVFHPDPLSPTRRRYGETGLIDNNDTDSAQLGSAQFPAMFPLAYVNGAYQLSGTYAVCADFEAPMDNACPIQRSNMLYFNRSSNYFEAVNAYYHINHYLHYVNKTLGITAMPYQYAGGVQYDPHGLNGADNSHYISSLGRLAFGQGGVDDAEDADVIIHELGHGLHDWITLGNLSRIEGLSEGVGDYLAAGYSRDLNQWQAKDDQYHWVMNWDGHNEFWSGRVTNWHIGRSYADARSAPIHTAGQYWASCNLIARDAIGGVAMDRALLGGLSMTNRTTDQKAAAQAVIVAAKEYGYSQQHIDAIAAAYNTSCTYDVSVPRPS